MNNKVKAIRIKMTAHSKEFWSKIKKYDENGQELDEGILIGENEIPGYMESDAMIIKENGQIKIVIDDSYLNGVPHSKLIFAFNENEPNSVIMIKTSSGNGAYVFDEKRRRNQCEYNMGLFPLEYTVCTEDILNTVTYEKGGTLTVEYTVEINGVSAEGSRITLKVEPIRKA